MLYTLHLQCLLLKIVFIAPSTYYYILFKHNHCQSMTQYMYHVTTPTDVQYVATMLKFSKGVSTELRPTNSVNFRLFIMHV